MKNIQQFNDLDSQYNQSHHCMKIIINDYPFLIRQDPRSKHYLLTTSINVTNDQEIFHDYLLQLSHQDDINYIKYDEPFISIDLNSHFQCDLKALLNELTLYFKEHQYISYCPYCHQEKKILPIFDQGHLTFSCQSCLETNMTQKIVSKHRHGFIGALLGGIIGIIIWNILSQFGVAFIAGAWMGILCLFGYQILGKYVDRQGKQIALITAGVMLILAELISLSLQIYYYANTYYFTISLISSVLLVPSFLSNSQIIQTVLIDLFLGYLIMFACSYFYLKYQKKHQDQVIEKL